MLNSRKKTFYIIKEIISSRISNFSVSKFPFPDYNPQWDGNENIILKDALTQEVQRSFIDAHDALKRQFVSQDLDSMSFYVKSPLKQELQTFLMQLRPQGLKLRLIDEKKSNSGIEHLTRYDQFFWPKYGDGNLNEKYKVKNFLNKSFFKKFLCIPKSGILSIRDFKTIVVVDALIKSELRVGIYDKNNRLVQGSKHPFEMCMIQFTSLNKFSKTPLSLLKQGKEDDPKDSFGWKISNLNHIVDEEGFVNIFG